MDDVKYTKKVTAFNDDDIPYEVRMKHIIEAYRKDLKRLEALEKYGFFKGSFLAVKRILRCHPFAKGGYDPVP